MKKLNTQSFHWSVFNEIGDHYCRNLHNEPGKKYREVFIDLGGQVMKVYRNELSPEEYFTYTTEEKEKLLVQQYADKWGSMEKGIKKLMADVKEKE